jgi:medium-chain acyl-[acyl-carrier-protein] hydrolase
MVTLPTFNSWIRCPNPNPQASFRLFCFPYAGGGASIFRTWSDSLPPYIEICPIQLPGRENRLKEAPFTDISPLVQTLAQVLRPYLNIPFAFFGHSMGALISFELARQLRAQQEPGPVHLFISGRRAPQIRDRNPLIHTLPEPEFLEELRRLNGTPQVVLDNAELMQLFLPILRADFSICGTYTYLSEPPLDCSISAFGGIEDTGETSDLIESWSVQTRSCFSIQMLPGDHFFVYTSQQILLEMLAHELQQVVK